MRRNEKARTVLHPRAALRRCAVGRGRLAIGAAATHACRKAAIFEGEQRVTTDPRRVLDSGHQLNAERPRSTRVPTSATSRGPRTAACRCGARPGPGGLLMSRVGDFHSDKFACARAGAESLESTPRKRARTHKASTRYQNQKVHARAVRTISSRLRRCGIAVVSADSCTRCRDRRPDEGSAASAGTADR